MKTPTLVFFMLFFAACKKTAFVYPTKQYQEYEFSSLVNFGPYRLFTKEGEIKDGSLVNVYSNANAQFFYSPSSNFTGNQYKSFSFVNDDSVINTGIVPAGELNRTLTDAYDIYSSKYYIPANDTNLLNLHLGKYKLHHTATTSLGYTYYELNDPATVLKKSGEHVFVPIVRYIVMSTQANSFSFSTDRINNVFEINGIKKLGMKDTLLIQQFDLLLRRK